VHQGSSSAMEVAKANSNDKDSIVADVDVLKSDFIQQKSLELAVKSIFEFLFIASFF